MSLMEAIRRATGGKPRMEDKKPDEMEEEETDTSAEGDEKDVEAEGEEDDTSAEGEKKDAEDGEDETCAEDEEDKTMSAAERTAFARGRSAERTRVAKILGSKAAEANPALAAHLAFNTSDDVAKSLAALKASAPSASAGLASRMAGRGSRTGRGGEAPAGKRDAGAAWDKAMAAAGVKAKGK